MDLSKLPLHQKTTIIARKYIIAIANRVSEDEAVLTYINLKNQKEVLRILQRIKTGAEILKFVDTDYWDIYAEGKHLVNHDFSGFRDLEVKIKVKTSAKAMEIIGVNKGEILRRTKKMNGNLVNRSK